MLRNGIKHAYVDGPKLEHHWESGWLQNAFEFLVGGSTTD
jgi:hypothetical protein